MLLTRPKPSNWTWIKILLFHQVARRSPSSPKSYAHHRSSLWESILPSRAIEGKHSKVYRVCMLNHGPQNEGGLTPFRRETLEWGWCKFCLLLVSADRTRRVKLRRQPQRLKMARWGQISSRLASLIFFDWKWLFPQTFISKVRLVDSSRIGTDWTIQPRLQELLFQERSRNWRSHRSFSLSCDTLKTFRVIWWVSALCSNRKFHVRKKLVLVWFRLQRHSSGRRPVWEEYYALLTPQRLHG